MQNTSIVAKCAALAAIVGLAAVIPVGASAKRPHAVLTAPNVIFTPHPQPTCGPPVNTPNIHPCPV